MKPVHVIGVPLDLGGGRRGVDMGPSAFRIAGIGERIGSLGYTVADRGDLPAPIPETQELRDERKKYIREIAKVCQKVYQTTLGSLDEGAMPIVLGGRHRLGEADERSADRVAVGRRARRHDSAGNVPLRQRARDAARGAPRSRT